jgi:hypothetical protein
MGMIAKSPENRAENLSGILDLTFRPTDRAFLDLNEAELTLGADRGYSDA